MHLAALALKWIRQTIATVAVYHTQSLLAYFLFTANALHGLPGSSRPCGRVVTPWPSFQMMSPLDCQRKPVGQSQYNGEGSRSCLTPTYWKADNNITSRQHTNTLTVRLYCPGLGLVSQRDSEWWRYGHKGDRLCSGL